MILWLNGTFGVGKTTTAAALVAQDPRLRVFDPEWVGYLLMNNLADHAFADFQELAPWRTLVPVVADEISRFTGQDLVAVQTVLDQAWWDELRGGLTARGHDVRHVLLDATSTTLHQRIDLDPDGLEIRNWRHDHVEAYDAARPWLLESADLVVDANSATPEEIAGQVLSELGRSTPAAG